MCFRNERTLNNSRQRSLFGGVSYAMSKNKNAYTVFTIYVVLNNSIIYEVIIMRVEQGERVEKTALLSGAFRTRVRVSRAT